jgi:PAS domain S-box-containing protein
VNNEVIGNAGRIGEGLLSTLLDLLPDYFYVADADMRLVYVNRTAAEYFRLPKHEIVGKSFGEVEPDTEFARRFAELGRQIIASGEPHVGDFGPYNEPDGTLSYYRRYDIPFRHPQTGEPMVMGLVQDMTDRVERERQGRQIAAMDREMQIARDIHRSLLPKPLRTNWLDLAGFSVPATYAGGDFYDWLRTGDGSVVLTLGDVSGHGVGPALVAAECRAFWRVLAPSLSVREAVTRLNELVADDLTEGRFVTLAAAAVSPDGMLTIFSAGQGPVALLRPDGAVELLDTHALPLGIIPELTGGDATVRRLAPGDSLLMVSDGLTEARDAQGRQWSKGGLLAALERHRGLGGDRLLRAIGRENLAFADGQPPGDDRTVVVATYRGT